MNKQMQEVMQRRRDLLARIARQREQVAEIGEQWQSPLALADQGVTAFRFLRSHPVLVAGVAALLVMRRGGVMGLMKRAWQMWNGYRYLTALSTRM